MKKQTFNHLKSLQCKRLLKDGDGCLIQSSEEYFTILYNETKVSLEDLKQMILDNKYKKAENILVINERNTANILDMLADKE